MELITIYQCLCDQTRLRILHLLAHTPLCVCHFQAVLNEPQVKISKHLRYLKEHRMVESVQHQNWRIYKLPDRRGHELEAQLKCLQDCVRENKLFQSDLKRLKAVNSEADEITRQCCELEAKKKGSRNEACC